MAITKNLGGNRLGSGNKNNISLHNYQRSTHNLKESFKSAIAPGTLIPFYVNIGIPGDTFEFDLQSMVRTMPTVGPLFGSFKLQLDLFQIPIRLYNGVLHNDPMNIGMHMKDAKFPLLEMKAFVNSAMHRDERQKRVKCAHNSLAKYLGISGMGTPVGTDETVTRRFNAIPFIGYWDVVKNYYANKQEKMAYVIASEGRTDQAELWHVYFNRTQHGVWHEYRYDKGQNVWKPKSDATWLFRGTLISFQGKYLSTDSIIEAHTRRTLRDLAERDQIEVWTIKDDEIIIYLKVPESDIYENGCEWTHEPTVFNYESNIKLEPFELENIDRMRYEILSDMSLQNPFIIGEKQHGDYMPFYLYTRPLGNGANGNATQQNGIAVKTYQSDLFNNWVKTDWIDGPNGIGEITKIQTDENGAFKLDTLNVMQKIYNVLNRVVASGGTLADWNEAVYGEEAIKRAETPIYMGGMSSEIVFEEVISTAATEETSKVGSLAGKGTLVGRKGGKVIIKPREQVVIMGIVSITPRLDYTQGNAWYMTDLESLDDLHKPELDGIGFQELITEQMIWEDAEIEDGQVNRKSAGKVPAWINYMTAVDKAYSTFTEKTEQGFMILSRDYEMDYGTQDDGHVRIKDLTTYIDPTKFNYAFAQQSLDSQNFWVQIVSDVTARRKMSAKIIPNL